MKIFCYNIEDGGEERTDGICEFLKDEQPDIVALNELNGWDDKVSVDGQNTYQII